MRIVLYAAFLWLLIVALVGCDKLGSADLGGGRPVVRANGGATASLTIIACPPNDLRALAVGELIQVLTQHEELVMARDGGTARLTINTCQGGFLMPPALPAATLRR